MERNPCRHPAKAWPDAGRACAAGGYCPRTADRSAWTASQDRYAIPAHRIAWNSGSIRTITAASPAAAAAPWTAFDVATPTALHRPRRRPPTSALRVTTAKSGPGTSTSTVARARKEAYAGQST